MKNIFTLFLLSLFVFAINAQIVDVPGQPKDFKFEKGSCEDKTNRDVTFTFSSPTTGGEVIGYAIYHSTMNDDYDKIAVLPSEATTFRGSFSEGNNYFKISAYNAAGETFSGTVFVNIEPCIALRGTRAIGDVDIKGEALIYMEGSDIKLRNNDMIYTIPDDGSFSLYSSSYIYLTIDGVTAIELTSIDVAGQLLIKMKDNTHTTIDVKGNAGIKVGQMEIVGTSGTLDLKTSGSSGEYGFQIANSLLIDGKHTLSATSQKYGISAGNYIKVMNGATLDITATTTGVYSSSQIWVEGAAIVNVAVTEEDAVGILSDGDYSGIYLSSGSSTGDKITMNVTASQGCAIKINGAGSLIAEGSYDNTNTTWTTSLIATGKTGGVYLTGEGYVKADGAYIKGARSGADGNISAVHAPQNLYSLNKGRIEEIYENADLLFYRDNPYDIVTENPAIGNNMKSITTYTWTSTPTVDMDILSAGIMTKEDASAFNLEVERNQIVKKECTKVDSQSSHYIKLENNKSEQKPYGSVVIYFVERTVNDYNYPTNYTVTCASVLFSFSERMQCVETQIENYGAFYNESKALNIGENGDAKILTGGEFDGVSINFGKYIPEGYELYSSYYEDGQIASFSEYADFDKDNGAVTIMMDPHESEIVIIAISPK